MPVPVVLDGDPGPDDAVAIVVAAHHAELLGISTVAGNAPLEDTTRLAVQVRELLAIDVPVHPGGVDLLVDVCRRRPGTWIVATGPLTNVARALRRAPDLAGCVGGISLMGGGTFGNRTPVAETNIWLDPEAAEVVVGYGGPLVMAGLDVTHQLIATPDRLDELGAVPGPLAELLHGLVAARSQTYAASHDDLPGAAVHDPCAVLAITHPHLFQRRSRHVAVETAGHLTRGMTVIDRRSLVDRPPPNCEVLERVDADAAWAAIVEAVRWRR